MPNAQVRPKPSPNPNPNLNPNPNSNPKPNPDLTPPPMADAQRAVLLMLTRHLCPARGYTRED